MQGYRYSSNREDMDVAVIHGFLTNSPWAKGISLEAVTEAVDNSLTFGVFTEQNEQIACGRVVTDFVTFAYMCDAFVREDHQKRGISKWLMGKIMDDPRIAKIRRLMIATTDAHGLYEKFGFKTVAKPEFLIEKWNWQAYKQQP